MRLPPRSAARSVAVCLLTLVFAALLNAKGMRKTAEIQQQGWQRGLGLAVAKPLVDVSSFLHLTAPRHGIQVALGRQSWDQIDTQVHFTVPPATHPTRPAPSPARRKPRATLPRFTAARPLRVWVAGDSLAEVPGQGLERVAGPDVDIVGVESRLSTGLARPDLYNWFLRIPVAVRQLVPRVVVFSFGADDAHDYLAGVPKGRTVGPLGSPSWDAEYRRRVEGVTRELAARQVFVVWLGLPIPDGSGFKHSFPIVNRILEQVAKANPGTSTYVDTWHMLDDAHGRYTAYLRENGQLTLMRLPDGVHYTAAAGDLIARQVLSQLRERFAF
ncbi:MAG TPA: hypothetical protein VF094_13165 [Gaiellaceae bacterium]